MPYKKTILAGAACLLLVASLATFTGQAFAAGGIGKAAGAAGGDLSGDQKLANQDGLATKEFDKDKLPGKLEIGFTIGSVVAVIAAFKYL
jgi:hypothetical protein